MISENFSENMDLMKYHQLHLGNVFLPAVFNFIANLEFYETQCNMDLINA